MSPSDRVLFSFAPRWMALQLARRLQGEGPAVLSAQGAVLFADVAGFTQLARNLAERHGAAGADHLQRVLNAVFGALAAQVELHGGEVVRFAGDGLLAHWPALEGAADSLALAAARAEACAHALASTVASSSRDDAPVRVHVAVCAGPLTYGLFGGHRERWECVLLGDALRQLEPTLKRAGIGEVALSPEAHAAARAARRATMPPPLAAEPVTESERAILAAVVPHEVRSRVSQGLEQWLAELRALTVLFLTVPGAEREEPAALHRVVRLLQQEVERNYGFLKEVSVDDKGLVAVALFGLSGRGAGFRPGYAVACALRVQAGLRELGLRAHAGVATDRLFCGTVGGDARREYTSVGRAMILAARLCFLAEGVLCDEPTALAARGSVALEGPRPVSLKGFEQAVPAWRALRLQRGVSTRGEGLVGRSSERAALESALDVAQGGGRAVVVLEGDAGMGKSLLLDAVVSSARERGMPTFVAVGDALGMAAPYDAVRPIAEQLFDLSEAQDPEERGRRVRERFEGTPRAELCALLNPLLGTALPEAPATENLRDFLRAAATRELFCGCFREACGESATLLVVEDGHWLDGASLDLLEGLRALLTRGVLLFATRPLGADAPKSVRALAEDPRTERLRVGPLSPTEAEALLASRLRVAEVPAELARWLHQRAVGHPLFCAELASALEAEGLLVSRDGVLEVSPTPEALRSFAAPTTVEGTILHRIDQLPDAAQWTLKAAAVLGRTFAPERLAALHPLGLASAQLEATLDELVEAKLCDRSESGYTFRHRITQEVAYGALVASQRQRLHRAAAESLAARHQGGAGLRASFAELSHHWLQTEEPERALPYLEGAWEDADREGASLEALGFMQQALALDDARRAARAEGVEPLRRATWLRRVAEAHVALGRHGPMFDACCAALPLLGERAERTSRGWKLALLAEVSTQAAHRMLPARAYELPEEARAQAREAARVWTRQAEATYYLGRDLGQMIYAAFRAVNLAERGGGGAVVTTAYGQVGLMMGALGLEEQGRYYLAQARRNAEATGLPRELSGAFLAQVALNANAGRWEQALERIEEDALPQLLESRSHLIGPMLSLSGHAELYAGMLPRARKRARLLQRLELGNDAHAGWGLALESLVELAEGAFARALERAEQSIARLREDPSVITARGGRVLALARLERTEDSLEAAALLLETMKRTPVSNFHRLDSFAAPAEAFLLALSRGGYGGGRAEGLRALAESLRVLERFAKRSAAGVPRLAHLRALEREAQGRGDARAALEAARRVARERRMPWEEARIALDLAARGALDPAEPRALFAALGCAGYAEAARCF